MAQTRLIRLSGSRQITDATASRTLEGEKACLDRLSAAGAGIVTTEMVVFEWLGRAGTPEFKELLREIK